MFVKAIDTIDSKLARKFTCKDGLDWLAADMSRICMSYIFNCNVLELSQLVAEVTRDRSAFIQRLVTLVKKNYPLSKPMIVSTNQSHSGTKSGGVLGIMIAITMIINFLTFNNIYLYTTIIIIRSSR
jgi:hypothetical protein